MTEPSQQTTLSSTYWDLHRNTLLFSSLLLIMCVPGVKPATSQSFLWLSFTDLGFNSLRVIAFIAASYAFAVYVLEWQNEPLALYRKERGLAASSREHMDQLVSSLTSDLSIPLNTLRDAMAASGGTIPEATLDNYRLANQEIGEIVQRSYNSHLIDIHGQERHLRQRFEHSVAAHTVTAQEISESINPAIQNVAQRIARTAAMATSNAEIMYLKEKYESVVAAIDILERRMDDVVGKHLGLRALRFRMIVATSKWNAKSYVRVKVIGLFIPITVYATAIAHLGGQLGYGYLPSAFSLIEKAPAHKAPAIKGNRVAPASTKG